LRLTGALASLNDEILPTDGVANPRMKDKLLTLLALTTLSVVLPRHPWAHPFFWISNEQRAVRNALSTQADQLDRPKNRNGDRELLSTAVIT